MENEIREKILTNRCDFVCIHIGLGMGEGYSAHCQMPRKMCVCFQYRGERENKQDGGGNRN